MLSSNIVKCLSNKKVLTLVVLQSKNAGTKTITKTEKFKNKNTERKKRL